MPRIWETHIPLKLRPKSVRTDLKSEPNSSKFVLKCIQTCQNLNVVEATRRSLEKCDPNDPKCTTEARCYHFLYSLENAAENAPRTPQGLPLATVNLTIFVSLSLPLGKCRLPSISISLSLFVVNCGCLL